MRTDYWDTILFAVAAVLAVSWLIVNLWYRSILRELDQREEDCLKDEDMQDEDSPTTNLKRNVHDNE